MGLIKLKSFPLFVNIFVKRYTTVVVSLAQWFCSESQICNQLDDDIKEDVYMRMTTMKLITA